MKYLIQNKKEFAIAVGVCAVNAYNLYKALRRGVVEEQTIAAFVYAALTLMGLYYNIPTSEENCRHTGQMRAEKLQKQIGTDGENFSDEPEDEEDLDEENPEDEAEEGEIDG